jgi:hypothetical protein
MNKKKKKDKILINEILYSNLEIIIINKINSFEELKI